MEAFFGGFQIHKNDQAGIENFYWASENSDAPSAFSLRPCFSRGQEEDHPGEPDDSGEPDEPEDGPTLRSWAGRFHLGPKYRVTRLVKGKRKNTCGPFSGVSLCPIAI